MKHGNGLPDDEKAPCICGHYCGAHVASVYERGKVRNVTPDQTHCAFCDCPRFTPPPATWEFLLTDPLEGL